MTHLTSMDISRRIAAARYAWVRHADGRYERSYESFRRAEISEVSGMWRAVAFVDERSEEVWKSTDLRECMDMADAAEACERACNEWLCMAISPTSLDIGNGLSVVIQKGGGDDMATALVLNGDGAKLGDYRFTRTEWPADYVMGVPTVNGGCWLDVSIRGKGVCKRLYDAVEAVIGMPIVPHGRNFVEGGLSQMATRFWEKRSAERHVPGNDREAQERLIEVKRATACLMPTKSLEDADVVLSRHGLAGDEMATEARP